MTTLCLSRRLTFVYNLKTAGVSVLWLCTLVGVFIMVEVF